MVMKRTVMKSISFIITNNCMHGIAGAWLLYTICCGVML
jgi:hypothetical protein